jgi:hypothetical protein
VIVFIIGALVVLAMFAVYIMRARTPEQSSSERPTRSESATISSTTPNDAGAEGMASPGAGEVGPTATPPVP